MDAEKKAYTFIFVWKMCHLNNLIFSISQKITDLDDETNRKSTQWNNFSAIFTMFFEMVQKKIEREMKLTPSNVMKKAAADNWWKKFSNWCVTLWNSSSKFDSIYGKTNRDNAQITGVSTNYTCRRIFAKEQEDNLTDFLVYRGMTYCEVRSTKWAHFVKLSFDYQEKNSEGKVLKKYL